MSGGKLRRTDSSTRKKKREAKNKGTDNSPSLEAEGGRKVDSGRTEVGLVIGRKQGVYREQGNVRAEKACDVVRDATHCAASTADSTLAPRWKVNQMGLTGGGEHEQFGHQVRIYSKCRKIH